jgi:nickel-dependent lactate racemase
VTWHKEEDPVKVPLRYGQTDLSIEIPQRHLLGVVEMEPMPVLANPRGALAAALSHPMGTAPLADLAKGKESACVVISDNTRPVPHGLLLPAILKTLGAHVKRTTILVASGLHHPLGQGAIQELVGSRLPDSCRVVCHDAQDNEQLVELGHTGRGLPITINKAYIESDLKILTGLVEPHFMAGYSGGRKSICPGIAGRRTIQLLHSPLLLESPGADSCILEGNPVHEEAMEIARTARADFIVNVAIDGHNRISKITAGELEIAWLACVAHVSRYAEVEIETEADVVITSNGGYPQDRDYYQAVKGLVAASRVVKEGGAIILVSECRDGLGSRSFRDNLVRLREAGDPAKYLAHVGVEAQFTPDQWEVEKLVQVLRRTSHLFVCSEGLEEEDAAYTFAERVCSVDEGIQRALALRGDDARILVMPHGPYVIPTARHGLG